MEGACLDEVRRSLSRILRASPSKLVKSGAARDSPLGIGSAALVRRPWQSGGLSVSLAYLTGDGKVYLLRGTYTLWGVAGSYRCIVAMLCTILCGTSLFAASLCNFRFGKK